MEYKFMHTINGPAVVSEDEVIFFHQSVALMDYADADPDFVTKAKAFIAEEIVGMAQLLANSLSGPTVGVEYGMALPTYVTAIHHINNFEQFLRQQVR
jgi:hypothetical protein